MTILAKTPPLKPAGVFAFWTFLYIAVTAYKGFAQQHNITQPGIEEPLHLANPHVRLEQEIVSGGELCVGTIWEAKVRIYNDGKESLNATLMIRNEHLRYGWNDCYHFWMGPQEIRIAPGSYETFMICCAVGPGEWKKEYRIQTNDPENPVIKATFEYMGVSCENFMKPHHIPESGNQ